MSSFPFSAPSGTVKTLQPGINIELSSSHDVAIVSDNVIFPDSVMLG